MLGLWCFSKMGCAEMGMSQNIYQGKCNSQSEDFIDFDYFGAQSNLKGNRKQK